MKGLKGNAVKRFWLTKYAFSFDLCINYYNKYTEVLKIIFYRLLENMGQVVNDVIIYNN